MSFLLHLSDLHLSPTDQRDAVGDYKSDIIPLQDRMTRKHLLENTLRVLAGWLDERRHRLDAVLHHQLLPVSVAEEVKPYETITNLGDVRDFLHSNEIDIVLHGHKHVSHLYWDHCYDYSADDSRVLDAGAGRPVLVCSAGSIGSVGAELGKLIEVDAHLPHVSLVNVARVPAVSAGRPLFANLRTDMVRVKRSQPVLGEGTPVLLAGESVTDVYHQLTEKFDDESVHRVRNLVCFVAKGSTALALPDTYPEVKGYSGEGRTSWTALDCVAFFRNQEMRFWWPINMAEIARLQRHVIQQLAEDGTYLAAGSIVTQTAIAYPGTTSPKVIIPMIDRVWQDDRDRLWSMAYALFHPDAGDREARLRDWELMFDDWMPSDQLSAGGVPVPIEGLEALRDVVKFFTDKHESASGRRIVKTLSAMLDANTGYLEQELRTEKGSRERRGAHQRWRDRIIENAGDLSEALTEITAGA